MTDLLSTGQREPQIPNEALFTTGKLMWYIAPILPVKTTKNPAIEYPIQTQSHAGRGQSRSIDRKRPIPCHQLRPTSRDDAAIIHVLMLKLSAIQNVTKLICFHCRRSGSTGFKSWLVKNNCLLVRPGSTSHSYRLGQHFLASNSGNKTNQLLNPSLSRLLPIRRAFFIHGCRHDGDGSANAN